MTNISQARLPVPGQQPARSTGWRRARLRCRTSPRAPSPTAAGPGARSSATWTTTGGRPVRASTASSRPARSATTGTTWRKIAGGGGRARPRTRATGRRWRTEPVGLRALARARERGPHALRRRRPQAVGADDLLDGRAVALADLFNRGALDVVVANQNGPLLVYQNEVEPGAALDPVRARRARAATASAIGAQVTLDVGGARQCRPCSPAQRLLQPERPSRCTSAWARARASTSVVIRWPSGAEQHAATRVASAGQRTCASSEPRRRERTRPAVPRPSARAASTRAGTSSSLLTLILVIGQWQFQILGDSYVPLDRSRWATAVAAELVLGRLQPAGWPNLLSAYISGNSVAILVKPPGDAPVAVRRRCALLSIASKYVLRYAGGTCGTRPTSASARCCSLAPDAVSDAQPPVGQRARAIVAVIWAVGLLTVWRARVWHMTLAYLGGFVALRLAARDAAQRPAVRGPRSRRSPGRCTAVHVLHDHRPAHGRARARRSRSGRVRRRRARSARSACWSTST